jgi:hypothetical protein
VRRGASWTAAYHLQLTVAAVARPVPSGVDALGVLAAERSWWLLAQTTFARRSVQPGSRGRASSPWSTLPASHATASVAGVQHGCPPIPVRCPGSGCPAVRCLVTWGRPPAGPALGRLLSTRPVSSRLVAAPVRPDASVSSMLRRWRWEPGRGGRATVTTGTGGGPGGCRAVDARSTVEEAGRRATLPKSRWSVGGRWRTRAAGLGAGRGGRACPLRDQAGQAGVPSARGGRLRGGRGSRLQREVAASAAWLPSSAGGATTVRGRRRA